MSYSPELQFAQASDDCHSVKTLDEAVWRRWEQKNRNQTERATAKRLAAVKWFCIVALLSTAALWAYAPLFDLVLRTIVAMGAVVVLVQAANSRAYAFAALFAVIVLLYNPVVRVFDFSGGSHLTIVLGTAIPFAASLIWLRVSTPNSNASFS
jgi:hypothetical protein